MGAKLAKGSRRRIALGQHMLVSDPVADRVIAACNLSPGDRVLEIGTGFGILTRRLAESKAVVITYEIDEYMFEQTKKSFAKYPNVKAVRGDAFESNLDSTFDFCVTSLPYSQSLRFIRWLALNTEFFSRTVAIVQQEFAEKLVSTPGTPAYRAISVVAQISFQMQELLSVSKAEFDPPPKVESRVLKFLPNNLLEQPYFNKRRLQIIDLLFSFRGRFLASAIRKLVSRDSSINLSRNILETRIEKLSPMDYSEILPQIEQIIR